jgi:DNA mismatch endonuclease, patch repair protein
MDIITTSQRSDIMSRIGVKNTKPELAVRRILHGMGYRFRLHRKDLPGKPDIVLPCYETAIMVHGCFWHGHSCKRGRKPASNTDFWNEKLARNKKRDRLKAKELRKLGWKVLVVWECETKDMQSLAERLDSWLKRSKVALRD